ncbi:DUF6912 family protein, partial [Saccharothrix sp. ST-888]|uniref:DUF6912 family protein n=1 Tax=Saccharothrix sp. ST-888 TaxID=1427391 RepID=UPI003FA787AB
DQASLGRVELVGTVWLAKAAAVHADVAGTEVGEEVTAAAESIAAADKGAADAQFTVDGAEDYDLLWFDTQEIPSLNACEFSEGVLRAPRLPPGDRSRVAAVRRSRGGGSGG